MPQITARGQITIQTVRDGYTITQSIGEYLFPAYSNGVLSKSITLTSTISVVAGDVVISDFTIGTPSGDISLFHSISIDNECKNIQYAVQEGCSIPADSGIVSIPVVIAGVTYTLSFVWSKAKAGTQGEPGNDGIDANMLDWVKEWDSGRTVITGDTLITPKIFAGVHNGNGTLTGSAIGRFSMVTRNAQGEFQSEVIDGIYGFRDGFKTFAIDSTGSVVFGRAKNSITYNALTGEIEFGEAVSMQWAGATYIDKDGIFTGILSADTVNAIRINAGQIVAGTIDADRIDVASLKAQLITTENIEGLSLNFVRGKIGCWNIDSDSIYSGTKNNALNGFTAGSDSVTIGSNGIRGHLWRLESTGAGALAGGNIVWDIYGNVTFGNSVSLYWINAASDALDQAKEYADGIADDASEMIDATAELARAMAYGRMLYRDPTFLNDMNGITAYNTLNNGNVTITRTTDVHAPTDNKNILLIQNRGTSSPGCGGFRWMTQAQVHKIFIVRLIAKIPAGRSLLFYEGGIGFEGSHKWLTSSVGTGYYEEYIYKIVCGMSGFSTTNFFYLSGAVGTANYPVEWSLAYATVFDITSSEKLTTTIDADGIYTGTLTAQQVNAVDIDASSIRTGYLSADRIEAGSISADKLDADSIRANVINTDYINGLTLTFERGLIGGWSIDSTGIYTGSFGTVGAVPIQIRTASTGSGYWYTGAYKPDGLSLLWYRTSNSGHIVFGQVAASGNTVKTGFYGIQMMSWDGLEYFTLSANTVLSGSKEVYNRIAGWAFDSTKIWKNNVSLGSDGSITNGTLWKLNNDGSGQLANGNIKWDTAGNVTFSESVTLNWNAEDERVDAIIAALGGSSYSKLTYITSTGIYTGTLTANQVNVTGINATNITTGTLSADRIAAGSIDATKINVSSLQASIVTTSYLEGLTLNFTKGKIGGWTIGSDNISSGNVGTTLATAIQIRTASSGSGYWYSGAYKPAGIALTWLYSSNAGHIVMGQVAASATTVKSGYYGIQMMDYLGYEYFCLSASTTASTRTVYNRIAGWGFDYQQIWKNNVYLSSDGSIVNGTKWKLNNDGSGQIANGNISWNASGTVTFSASVALNWSDGALDEIIAALGGTTYPKLTYISSTGIYTGTINANQIVVNSTLIVGGTTSATSYNGVISVRNTSNTAIVTLDRTGITATAGKIGGWTMTSSSIYAGNVYLNSAGSITNSSRWALYNDGSGLLANNNIYWDSSGNINIKNAIIQDVTVKGSIRAPFVRVDGSITVIIGGGSSVTARSDSEKYDNLCIIGGQDSGGWGLQTPSLPWTVDQSGRRLTLTHYRYNSEYVYGTVTFTAPSGKYFYENGMTATTLKMSRQAVELMGFGTSTTFHGWIVLNRRDLGTTYRYGEYGQYLAMGAVTATSSAASIKYKTFDGSTGVSVARTGTGLYNVYLPWSLGADKYMVMLSGIWLTGPIYGTIKAQYSSYFTVQTQDDASANNGSFNFVVVSTADFT